MAKNKAECTACDHYPVCIVRHFLSEKNLTVIKVGECPWFKPHEGSEK